MARGRRKSVTLPVQEQPIADDQEMAGQEATDDGAYTPPEPEEMPPSFVPSYPVGRKPPVSDEDRKSFGDWKYTVWNNVPMWTKGSKTTFDLSLVKADLDDGPEQASV